MGAKIRIPGINIQHPWSELIVEGEKTIETRAYPIPGHLVNQRLAIIETKKNEAATIVGIVIFSHCYKYESLKHWKEDFPKHRVPATNESFAFSVEKPKWAWVISEIIKVPSQPGPAKKGIKYAKECEVLT